jgi:hypothetical protein
LGLPLDDQVELGKEAVVVAPRGVLVGYIDRVG